MRPQNTLSCPHLAEEWREAGSQSSLPKNPGILSHPLHFHQKQVATPRSGLLYSYKRQVENNSQSCRVGKFCESRWLEEGLEVSLPLASGRGEFD